MHEYSSALKFAAIKSSGGGQRARYSAKKQIKACEYHLEFYGLCSPSNQANVG